MPDVCPADTRFPPSCYTRSRESTRRSSRASHRVAPRVHTGALSFPATWAIFGDARLAAAVSIALLAAGTVATTIGLLLPWALARLGRDPAFGSGPIATIVQDVLSLVDLLRCRQPAAVLSGPPLMAEDAAAVRAKRSCAPPKTLTLLLRNAPRRIKRYRVMSTGILEWVSTFVAWLPSTMPARPLRPCEPMKIKSHFFFFAASIIACQGAMLIK